MIAAAIIPLVAVALGAIGVLEHRTAVQLALRLGVAVLAVQGIRYARLEHLHPGATFVTISLNLAIGLALVALEVLFAHYLFRLGWRTCSCTMRGRPGTAQAVCPTPSAAAD